MKSILIQANAKINLDLTILEKKPNGYHNIKSTFQSIDLADFILLEKSKNHFSGAIICPESESLILKAKKLLEQTIKKPLPCHIHLHKAIPIAAGLGGGSADAAATLFGLNQLYCLGLSKKELVEIGMRIGSDIPFFLYGGTCRVSGVGEKVKPLKMKMREVFVLFRPHKRVATKMMYDLHDKTGKDFLTLSQAVCPEIKTIKKYFSTFKLKLYLSGSGPTVFCATNNYRLAQKVSEGYPKFNGDIFICQAQKEALKIIKKSNILLPKITPEFYV